MRSCLPPGRGLASRPRVCVNSTPVRLRPCPGGPSSLRGPAARLSIQGTTPAGPAPDARARSDDKAAAVRRKPVAAERGRIVHVSRTAACRRIKVFREVSPLRFGDEQAHSINGRVECFRTRSGSSPGVAVQRIAVDAGRAVEPCRNGGRVVRPARTSRTGVLRKTNRPVSPSMSTHILNRYLRRRTLVNALFDLTLVVLSVLAVVIALGDRPYRVAPLAATHVVLAGRLHARHQHRIGLLPSAARPHLRSVVPACSGRPAARSAAGLGHLQPDPDRHRRARRPQVRGHARRGCGDRQPRLRGAYRRFEQAEAPHPDLRRRARPHGWSAKRCEAPRREPRSSATWPGPNETRDQRRRIEAAACRHVTLVETAQALGVDEIVVALTERRKRQHADARSCSTASCRACGCPTPRPHFEKTLRPDQARLRERRLADLRRRLQPERLPHQRQARLRHRLHAAAARARAAGDAGHRAADRAREPRSGFLPPGARRARRQVRSRCSSSAACAPTPRRTASRAGPRPRTTASPASAASSARFRIDEMPQLLNVLKRRDEPGRPASGAAVLRRAS